MTSLKYRLNVTYCFWKFWKNRIVVYKTVKIIGVRTRAAKAAYATPESFFVLKGPPFIELWACVNFTSVK